MNFKKIITYTLVTLITLGVLLPAPTSRAARTANEHQAPVFQKQEPVCELYAVDDIGQDNSQFFTIEFNTHAVSTLGPVHTDADIEGLDFDPTTHKLYGSAGRDGNQTGLPSQLYEIHPISGTLTLIGEIQDSGGNDFWEVSALSFRSDGTLWGFAREGDASRRGIVQFGDDPTITSTVQMILTSTLNVEAIAWNPDGDTLWLAQGKKLYSYQPGGQITHQWTFSSLPDDIEGLEARPDGRLMAGMDENGDGLFDVYVLDVSDGQVVTSDSFDTGIARDVESLAWPEWCTSQIGDTIWHDLDADGIQDDNEPGLEGVVVNLYNDQDDDGQFDPAIDDLIASQTTGSDGIYNFVDLLPGKYFVQVDESNFDAGNALAGHIATLQNAGDDDASDSDGDVDTFATDQIDLLYDVITDTWDLGFFSPAVQLTKETDQQITLGATANFTITVENTGEGILTGVTVSDTLAPGCAHTIGSLAASETTSYTCSLENVTADFVNVASVIALARQGDVELTDEDQASVDVPPLVTLLKSATPASRPEPGGAFTFTLTITNNANEPVTISQLSDTNPLSAECLALVGTNLTAGASTSCQYTVTHTEVGSYDNVASVTVQDDEQNTASDEDQATVSVISLEPAIVITKEADQTVVSGSDVTFTLTVENVGPVDLTDVTVTDPLVPDCGWVVGDLGIGETQSHTCTVENVTAGFVNSATAIGTDTVGTVVTDDDQASVQVLVPQLAIDKSSTPALADGGALEPGGEIEYEIVVTNIGEATQHNVTIQDPIPDHASYVDGSLWTDGDDSSFVDDPDGAYVQASVASLAPDEAFSLTFRVEVSEDFVDADNPILNVASAFSDELPDPIQDSTEDYVYVPPGEDTDEDGAPGYLDDDDDGDGCTGDCDEEDSDNDGTPDYLDNDDDGDGIPDDEEGTQDTDGDGTPDYLDNDDDGDGIPSADECPGGPPCADTDGDGTPDYLDNDDDGDGIPSADECPGGPPCSDSDGDGTPDYLDNDDDGDGIPSADECPGGPPCADSDGDGIPDYLDNDDDGDGIPSADECPGGPPCSDSDGDGTPDYLDNDDDGDGIPSADEYNDPQDPNDDFCSDTTQDSDGDGIPDCQDNDADGDGIPNYLDLDSDGDGVPDADEYDADGDGIPDDSDGDGIPDWLDPDPGVNVGPYYVFLPFVNR